MTQEEIKTECHKLFDVIKVAQDRLAEIRAVCTHENTHQGYFSYRVGNIRWTNICNDCGQPISPAKKLTNE